MIQSKRSSWAAWFGGAAIISVCASNITLAEPPAGAAAEAPAAAKDAKVTELLKSMDAFYSALPSARADMKFQTSISGPMGKQDQSIESSLHVERPNKLYYAAKGDGTGEQRIISDGTKLWSYVRVPMMMHAYTESEAPKELVALRETEAFDLVDGGLGLMDGLLGLFGGKGTDAFLDGTTKAEYLGEGEQDGTKYHRIKLTEPIEVAPGMPKAEIPTEYWVQAGDSPWLLRMVPDSDALSKMVGQGMQGVKFEMIMAISGWSTGANIPADQLTFAAPEGAKKVESLMKAASAPPEEPKPESLKGKPAPAFSVDQLGGSKVNLADHKGKNIVILDFWATWCGPCRKGLPIVNEVAAKYKDKGVVFYAVNIEPRDTPDAIKKMMETLKVDCPVLLDHQRTMLEAYMVGPIPHTAFIDRNGVLHSFHIGLPRGGDDAIRKQITDEIDAILAAEAKGG